MKLSFCIISLVSMLRKGLATKFCNWSIEDASVQAANKVAKKGGDIAAQHTARETAKKTATEAAKEIATKAARGAAKRAADESAKTLAKVTGSVTAVFGVLTCAWEGYNAYQNHCEMKNESPIGKELRSLAHRLENDYETNTPPLEL